MVDISIEIIEAEGGTRCAGITAAAVALADAGIPMRDIPVGCAAGKMNGDIVLDLSEKEDKEGQADCMRISKIQEEALKERYNVNG